MKFIYNSSIKTVVTALESENLISDEILGLADFDIFECSVSD
jgi:hypothetical protein